MKYKVVFRISAEFVAEVDSDSPENAVESAKAVFHKANLGVAENVSAESAAVFEGKDYVAEVCWDGDGNEDWA